jgi:hypothetical protein
MDQMTAMFSKPQQASKPNAQGKPRLLEGEIGGARKADVMAGEGSLADRLRKRRIDIEQGQGG